MKELKVRFAEMDDEKYLIKWLSDEEILKWFPMCNDMEIKDAARIWISYSKQKAVLTALWNNEPCGIANLYIQPFKKFAHQCLFAIIVDKNKRGKGIGSFLLKELIKLAKETFHIEILHLEVYEDNPAMNLYKRFGFKVYGFQKHFVKEANGKYRGKYLMQRILTNEPKRNS